MRRPLQSVQSPVVQQGIQAAQQLARTQGNQGNPALQAQAQRSLTPAGGFQPTPHAGTRTDVHGNDMAFQTRSQQTSARQNTGY